MAKRLLLASLLLLAPSVAFGQSSGRFESQAIGPNGKTLGNQNVAVCTQPANTSTTPCSPLATLATSTATTSGGANPLTTDALGNFFFYLPNGAGKVTIQIYGPQIQTPFVQPDVVVPLELAPIAAEVNLTAQNNNISATTLYAVPASGAGMYRASCYAVATTAAGTSSTLPNCGVVWTDNDTSTAGELFNLTISNGSNTVGTFVNGSSVINAKASTTIQYQTTNYASNPANAMQYAVHIRLEFLGP